MKLKSTLTKLSISKWVYLSLCSLLLLLPLWIIYSDVTATRPPPAPLYDVGTLLVVAVALHLMIVLVFVGIYTKVYFPNKNISLLSLWLLGPLVPKLLLWTPLLIGFFFISTWYIQLLQEDPFLFYGHFWLWFLLLQLYLYLNGLYQITFFKQDSVNWLQHGLNLFAYLVFFPLLSFIVIVSILFLF